ncbi:MAG TPA: hypothetical protein VHO24_05020, partial [Opitutaceae bacterium]|nr:hypothetical protein [Opitutaceae bacterium]
ALSYAQTRNGPTLLLAQEGGDAQLALSSPSFLLLDQDRLKRRQVLRMHWEWLDCERALFEQETKRIANDSDPNERFRKLERWKARSAENYYRTLSETRVAQRKVTLADFKPSPAHGLLSHLRLSESTGPRTIAELMQRSATELLEDVGVAHTFRRLATLPITMPATVGDSLARMDSASRADWVATGKEEFRSPPAFLHFVCLLARVEPDLALEMLEEKIQGNAQSEFEAFQLIHFWTLSQLELRPEVNRWAGKTKLALAWLHASRLFDILIRASTHEIISEYFAEAIRPTIRDVFNSDRDFETEAVHPRQLRFRSFYVHALLTIWPTGVGNADRFQGILRKLCFIDPEKQTPHPDLLLPASWLQNSFGSFIAGDRSEVLRDWFKDEAVLFSTEFATNFFSDHLRRAGEWKSSELTSWAILQSIVGVNRLPEALHQKAIELAADDRFVGFVAHEPEVRKPALWFLAHQCADLPETRTQFSDQLVRIARELARSQPSRAELDELITLIVECAHVTATGEPVPQRASDEFSALMIRILEVWPNAIDEFWPTLRGLTARLSPAVAVGLWPLVLELRKRTRTTTVPERPAKPQTTS